MTDLAELALQAEIVERARHDLERYQLTRDIYWLYSAKSAINIQIDRLILTEEEYCARYGDGG